MKVVWWWQSIDRVYRTRDLGDGLGSRSCQQFLAEIAQQRSQKGVTNNLAAFATIAHCDEQASYYRIICFVRGFLTLFLSLAGASATSQKGSLVLVHMLLGG